MSSPAPQFRSRMPRIAEAAAERVRLSVVPRARSNAPRVPFVTLVTVILLGGVVGLLLFNTSMQQSSFATTTLQHQADTLDARQQSLQMQLDSLRDPQRVAMRAQRLGMVPAGTPAFLDLDTGKVLGTPEAASADGLRIRPYPAAKPPELDPPDRVIHVAAPPAELFPGTSTDNSPSDTTATSPNGRAQAGRND